MSGNDREKPILPAGNQQISSPDQSTYQPIQCQGIGYYIPPNKPRRLVGIIERYTENYTTPEVRWWYKIHGGE